MSRFPHKNRAAVGGSLENFILDRNFQSRSKSRIFLIFGPSGMFIGFFLPRTTRGAPGIIRGPSGTIQGEILEGARMSPLELSYRVHAKKG